MRQYPEEYALPQAIKDIFMTEWEQLTKAVAVTGARLVVEPGVGRRPVMTIYDGEHTRVYRPLDWLTEDVCRQAKEWLLSTHGSNGELTTTVVC